MCFPKYLLNGLPPVTLRPPLPGEPEQGHRPHPAGAAEAQTGWITRQKLWTLIPDPLPLTDLPRGENTCGRVAPRPPFPGRRWVLSRGAPIPHPWHRSLRGCQVRKERWGVGPSAVSFRHSSPALRRAACHGLPSPRGRPGGSEALVRPGGGPQPGCVRVGGPERGPGGRRCVWWEMHPALGCN